MSDDLVELPGGDVEDEASHRVLVRDEGVGLDPGDGLADVLVEVREGLGRPLGLDAGVVLMDFLKPSSVKVSIPQSVWWIRMISCVPSRRWLMASERISSSVTTPPALRMTWASDGKVRGELTLTLRVGLAAFGRCAPVPR
ncbi:hypothetical protein GCM10009836_35660 [Pseudonocardia ailaonensis]|uniref:Uncharacterized protein n=1 Tax=Pseudonocardia ailaonensis TaxID=367279 RepID=A0ABN2N4L0_9PSEU